jgi:uncharacterized membrane protein YcaP (DUF421 family)
MGSIIRGLVCYVVLLFLFRIAGKRSLAKITTFDLVLTLIISEAVQQALLDGDESITNGFLLIVTLIGLDIAFSVLKHRFPTIRRIVDGQPVVVVRDGALVPDHLDKERVEKDDVLASARERLGVGNMSGIKHANLEESGGISVIPANGSL